MRIVEVSAKDFCCFEQFTQPLDKQGLVWVTGENNDTQSAANNGSGKSTLFKALTWGLYGHTIDGEKGDKVIRAGRKTATVQVVLEGNGKRWVVKRQRSKGAPKLELTQPDNSPFMGAKGIIQDKIIDMIGLDFHAFKNTVLYGQNDTARFADVRTKDAERKAMLHRILRTGVLAHCHEIALERRRELKGQLSKLEHEVDVATTALAIRVRDASKEKADQADYERRRKQMIKERTERAHKHKRKAERYAKEAKDVGKDKEESPGDEIESVKKQIRKAKKAVQKANDLATGIEALDGAASAIRGRITNLTQQRAHAAAKLSSTVGALTELDGAKCPTCHSSLDKGPARFHKIELQKSKGFFELAVSKYKEEWAKADEELEATLEKRRELRRKSDSSKHWILLGELEKRLSAMLAAQAQQAQEAKLLKVKSRTQLEYARGLVSEIKGLANEVNPYDERLSSVNKELRKLRKEMKALKASEVGVSEERAHVDFWVRGFSNQGLPSYILDSVMPYLADRANHYLEVLADGDITMEFATQREKKATKGEYRDEICIDWEIEGVQDSYPPSGGQLKKMEIATDLALMDLVATREGNRADLLILDEVLDGLDAEGRQRVLLLLNEMRAKRGSIFVISHEAEVAEIFEKAIYAVKKDGVSTLTRR